MIQIKKWLNFHRNLTWTKATSVAIYMILILTIASYADSRMSNATRNKEINMKASDIFLYEYGKEVIPIKKSFKVGELMTFRSNALQFIKSKIKYSDTPRCINRNTGSIAWLPEQVGTTIHEIQLEYDTHTWDYSIMPIPEWAQECTMCGIITGYTPVYEFPKNAKLLHRGF